MPDFVDLVQSEGGTVVINEFEDVLLHHLGGGLDGVLEVAQLDLLDLLSLTLWRELH